VTPTATATPSHRAPRKTPPSDDVGDPFAKH
jgi:hypothetical protein